jgi:peptidoglycan/LPS O-acetylase OafA/YrhL
LLACFLAGSVFFVYHGSVVYSGWLFTAVLSALVVLGAAPRLGLLSLALPALGAYILFYLAFRPNRHLHEFAKRGDLSYGLYLYAFPVQVLLVRYFESDPQPLVVFSCALPLSAILATLSWHFIESPFLRYKETRVRTPIA